MRTGERPTLWRTYEREPLWAIGLSALLVATSFARRPAGLYSGRADHTELEAGRGRFAEGPSEIPARGWKDILLRVYDGISEDRILANAAGVTYYALLALFPGIAALVSILGSSRIRLRSSAISMRLRALHRAGPSTSFAIN